MLIVEVQEKLLDSRGRRMGRGRTFLTTLGIPRNKVQIPIPPPPQPPLLHNLEFLIQFHHRLNQIARLGKYIFDAGWVPIVYQLSSHHLPLPHYQLLGNPNPTSPKCQLRIPEGEDTRTHQMLTAPQPPLSCRIAPLSTFALVPLRKCSSWRASGKMVVLGRLSVVSVM
jgi:hypothetical protein